MRPGGLRVLRVSGLVVAVLLAVVIVAVGAGYLWLHTEKGSEELGRIVTHEAQSSIKGELRLRGLRVSGFLDLCVEGLDLRDPDGNHVLSADRVCLHVNPLALKANKVQLSAVRLEKPALEIATVPGEGGATTTTLARAIAPRKAAAATSAPDSGPLKWVIDVRDLALHKGSVTLRPGLKEPPSLALEALELANVHARYAADGAQAALQLGGKLTAPGEAEVALELDAQLDGTPQSGKLQLAKLHAQLGKSGLSASGTVELGALSGELKITDLIVRPEEIALFAGQGAASPLASAVRGTAELGSDGKTATAALHLQAAGGTVEVKARSTLAKVQAWSVEVEAKHLDPAALSTAAPHGKVTLQLKAKGEGVPVFDERGVKGDLDAQLHVGPAQLEKMGELRLELTANLEGRNAVVRAFTATALGLQLKAKGRAALDAIALDLEVDAPNLRAVGQAASVLTKSKPPPISGAAHLVARLTGSPKQPDAQVHLRAPSLAYGPSLHATNLAVDGMLRGALRSPSGSLTLVAQTLSLGQIDLGAPRLAMEVAWPLAHLRVDAGVKGGNVQIAGDAKVDEDRDGVLLSRLTLSWPGNELHLAHDTRLHLRETETVLEPLELTGPKGALSLRARLRPKTARAQQTIDATVVLSRFALEGLPAFALPPDLGLRGSLNAKVTAEGAMPEPDVDLLAELKGGELARYPGVTVDAHTHARLHAGRVRASGALEAPGLAEVTFEGDLPALNPGKAPPSTELKLEAQLKKLDLAKLADALKLAPLQKARLSGNAEVRILAMGTLGAPRATLSLELSKLAAEGVSGVEVRAGLLLEKGKASLDGAVTLGGDVGLGFTAQAPFELGRLLRETDYLRAALDRPLRAELEVSKFPLARLAKAGLLPPESSGSVSLALHVAGTPLSPTGSLTITADDLSSGKLHDLGLQGELSVAERIRIELSAQTKGDVLAQLNATVGLSGAETVHLARHFSEPAEISALLDRPLELVLDLPGLLVGRAAQVAGQKELPAEGRLEGKITLKGTPAKPELVGRLAVRDLHAHGKQLGNAEIYLEGDAAHAALHVDINPPGGGSLLGHVDLVADLGARTLLAQGPASLREGELSGTLTAKKLDLAFLSGLAPGLRRTGGLLDAEVKLTGLLGSPVAEGDLHLRAALFDVVGQGIFDDVGLDATFSPKEIVLDRLTGSTGRGTYSAVLVASRNPDDPQGKIDFSGELHLGDDESVRDRKGPDGKPVQAGQLPLRQAGEPRADLQGEVDLFGDYSDGLLGVNVKIPEARLRVTALPDKKLPSLGPNPDVLLVHPDEPPHPPGKEPEEVAEEEKARKTSNFRLHAHLELVHLYVQAEDFEFPVESNLDFDYDAQHPDAPSADGTIHVPSGSFTALQRRFEINDAKITETGGDISDPELDVKATYENPKAVVDITVSGSAKDPQIDLSSQPVMDQDAIAFFLATGRVQGRATQSGGGVDLSTAATSVLGSLLFGQLRKELANVLPVDVLTLDQTQASVGKYLGDRIFVGYKQRLNPAPGENTSEGRVEYEVSKSVTAEATVGEHNSEMQILYTHDF